MLVTIHRPANVDSEGALRRVIDLLALVAKDHRVVFPVHPRTRNNLERSGQDRRLGAIAGLIVTPPLAYFDIQKLIATSAFVVTDSGGVQEETTYRGVPCLTLRESTERPITVTLGTNEIIPFDHGVVADAVARIRSGNFKRGRVPDLWDGHATERVFDVLERVL